MIFHWHLSCLLAFLYTSGVLGYPSCKQAPTATGDGCTYPSLINATSDQLQHGLSKGCFTSADLVKVCFWPYLSDQWLTVLGICGKNPRGQLNPAHCVGDQPRCHADCSKSWRREKEWEHSRVCLPFSSCNAEWALIRTIVDLCTVFPFWSKTW